MSSDYTWDLKAKHRGTDPFHLSAVRTDIIQYSSQKPQLSTACRMQRDAILSVLVTTLRKDLILYKMLHLHICAATDLPLVWNLPQQSVIPTDTRVLLRDAACSLKGFKLSLNWPWQSFIRPGSNTDTDAFIFYLVVILICLPQIPQLIKTKLLTVFTCVHNSVYLDALVVQLLGEGVHSLQQVLAGLWVDVRSPRWDLNCNRTHREKPQKTAGLLSWSWDTTWFKVETLVCTKEHWAAACPHIPIKWVWANEYK